MTYARKSRRSIAVLAAIGLGIALSGACGAGEYGDIAFQRKGGGGMEDLPPAVFPHWIHRMQFKCSACHEELFKMTAGANAVTMDAIQAGQSCGTCHDGKAAFESNFDTCPRCHSK